MLQANHCGRACPPENPVAFADALEYLADHPEECERMGENSRQLAEAQFNRDQLSDRFCEVLESVWARR
jgi:glycosyltransferase involved in cell wall biosynthesis